MPKIILGIGLLTISGLNIYLPDVGNLFDVWRINFSIVAFIIGWALFLVGSLEATD